MTKSYRNLFFNFILAWVIGGVIYPSLTYLASLVFPKQANGSLIIRNKKVVGSELLAQNFKQAKYFHPRSSEIDYLQPLEINSLFLNHDFFIEKVKKQVTKVRKQLRLSKQIAIPSDMVFPSASEVDPLISFENAMLQLRRVTKARNLPAEKIYPLIYEALTPNFVGLWGNSGVNVLKLNLLLDRLNENK